MSIENLSDNEMRSMEAEIRARRTESKPTHQHYGSVEDLSDSEIRSMEAEVKARRSEAKPTHQHYGSVESLSESETRAVEAEIAARRREAKPTYQHYGSVEGLSDSEIRNMEAEAKARRSEAKPTHQHYGSVESLSESETRAVEAEIRARRTESNPTHQHYGSVEDLSDSEIRSMEAEVKARRSEAKPTHQHYGSVENLSESETRAVEAEIAARRSEVKPTYQHYGSVENLSESETRILEAQVAEKRKQDIPYNEYFNNLIACPNIYDNQQFENAVIRSMQSNGIMRAFTSRLVEEISKATYGFKHIDKTNIENITKQKQKLENLVNVYVRYLYELKRHDWAFYGSGNNIGLGMISSDMLDDLWKVQKNFDLTFNMPIPKDLGEYYGKAFERMGRMIPGITLMYDDLKKKEVNWHQVIIYKENELTPRQRYLQRQAGVSETVSSKSLDDLISDAKAERRPSAVSPGLLHEKER